MAVSAADRMRRMRAKKAVVAALDRALEKIAEFRDAYDSYVEADCQLGEAVRNWMKDAPYHELLQLLHDSERGVSGKPGQTLWDLFQK